MNTNRAIKVACSSAVLVLMFATIAVWAQEGGTSQPGETKPHGRMMQTPEERTDHLTKALNLSDDQKGKVLSIYQDEQKQMSAVHGDSSLSREDRMSKMKQIRENTVSQIKDTLNPDQAKKFDEMQQKMEQRREQRKSDTAPPQQ
jgi:Spy/CpxP family protein refolding chaperone